MAYTKERYAEIAKREASGLYEIDVIICNHNDEDVNDSIGIMTTEMTREQFSDMMKRATKGKVYKDMTGWIRYDV